MAGLATLGRAQKPLCAKLELELIQSQIAQKQVLWGEVGARALRVWSVGLTDIGNHTNNVVFMISLEL